MSAAEVAAAEASASGTGQGAPLPWLRYSPHHRWWLLTILFLISTTSFLDRYVISVVLEPIKKEFDVSDTMLGLLSGPSFALFYAVAGLPVARWADRGDRRLIITLALTLWSLMTVMCGVVSRFWQLSVARAGVGISESGAIPPAQSLVADYFPPERRAMAVAILISASTVGYLLGLAAGGYFTATIGWRGTFLVAGAPGLALAVLARLNLAEPRIDTGFPVVSSRSESMREAASHLFRKKSFVCVFASSLAYFAFTYSMGFFAPTYLVRVIHAPLAQAGMTYGLVEAAANLAGSLAGGWLIDRLVQRKPQWLAWFPAITFVVAAPLYVVALAVTTLSGFLAIDLIATTAVAAAFPAVFATIHAICGNRRRATAIGLVLFSATLFGASAGPLLTGALSDALTASLGEAGLRYALMVIMITLFAAGITLHSGGRAIPNDLED